MRSSRPAGVAVCTAMVLLAGCAPSRPLSLPLAPCSPYLLSAGTVGEPTSKSFPRVQLMGACGPFRLPLSVPGTKDPDINRQGTAIVFERYPGEIWLADVRLGSRRISPLGGAGWAEPSFERDGRHIVATHDLGGGHWEIFRIDTVGGEVQQLTSTGARDPWKFRPSEDPTGTTLILGYGSDLPGTGRALHAHVGTVPLRLLPATVITPLTDVDVREPSYDGAFSPDGTHVVFDAGGMIWAVNRDGSGRHSIARGRIARFDPADGRRVLYLHDEGPIDTHTSLWSVDLDGSGAQRLVDGNFTEGFTALG